MLGANGEKGCIFGEPVKLKVAPTDLSTNRLLQQVNNFVFVTTVKGEVLGVKLDV